MSSFWVIDTKCKVLPQSVLPQDGSAYYYGRSVVPVESKEAAVEKLVSLLKEQDILVESVMASILYENGRWEGEDDFEIHLSLEESSNSGEIAIGCFISEKSVGHKYKKMFGIEYSKI
ncbi:MAG: hypothetical protein B0W54_23400 [Cellvibrio sp. 79]|nr:MAG: hypothetical protein B0W54_23400 [Cellvibrio sp. 79]